MAKESTREIELVGTPVHSHVPEWIQSHAQPLFLVQEIKVYEEKNKDNKFKATLNYPEELWTVPEGFRGAPYLVSDQNDNTKCVSCQLCEFVCRPRPSESASGNSEDAHREGAEKMPKDFEINMLRCIFCGFCEEFAPNKPSISPRIITKANEKTMKRDYALTGSNREEMIHKDQLLNSVAPTMTA